MEQFEVHTEHLQDLMLDLKKEGPKMFDNLPVEKLSNFVLDRDHLAYVDELAGLPSVIESIIKANDLPEHVQSKLRSYYTDYTGYKTKDQIRWELYEVTGNR